MFLTLDDLGFHVILFSCSWLVVKNWLVQRKRRLEHAPKRKWKRYWVCLKGTVLLFYDCNEQNSITEESVPRHILGRFYCNEQNSITEESVPRHILGKFDCNEQNSITGESVPRHILARFYCNEQNSMTEESVPRHILGRFDCNEQNFRFEINIYLSWSKSHFTWC